MFLVVDKNWGIKICVTFGEVKGEGGLISPKIVDVKAREGQIWETKKKEKRKFDFWIYKPNVVFVIDTSVTIVGGEEEKNGRTGAREWGS